MFYHFKTHKGKDGFWAECIELEGCNAQGDSLQELRENMEESLNLFLSEPESSKYLFPLPFRNYKTTKNIEKVNVSPAEFPIWVPGDFLKGDRPELLLAS